LPFERPLRCKDTSLRGCEHAVAGTDLIHVLTGWNEGAYSKVSSEAPGST
jgi:hypothetical protein